MGNLLYAVKIICGEEESSLLEELLAAQEMVTSSYIDKETHIGTVYINAENVDESAAMLEKIQSLLTDWAEFFPKEKPVASCAVIKEQDWSENWKQYFHTFRATERLVIKPSWEDAEIHKDDIMLELDPGMSFGTGSHGTTKACLQYLDELQSHELSTMSPVSFLDAGCGSGILSLGAHLLGYRPICAFDFNPQCILTTKQNLRHAGIADVEVLAGDVNTFTPPRQFQVVAANLLAHILLQAAENIITFVEHKEQDGYLLLSGILTDQYQEVQKRFTALGLIEKDSRTIDEWTSGCYIVPAIQ
ncbi:MAG: 50S ribosomal protein L11 methyltransferase [Lentisphaeria bacterium]